MDLPLLPIVRGREEERCFLPAAVADRSSNDPSLCCFVFDDRGKNLF